jgi:hypothetical protein
VKLLRSCLVVAVAVAVRFVGASEFAFMLLVLVGVPCPGGADHSLPDMERVRPRDADDGHAGLYRSCRESVDGLALGVRKRESTMSGCVY